MGRLNTYQSPDKRKPWEYVWAVLAIIALVFVLKYWR